MAGFPTLLYLHTRALCVNANVGVCMFDKWSEKEEREFGLGAC